MATSSETEFVATQTFRPIAENLGEKTVTCDKHGDYQSRGQRITTGKGREIWSPCPDCALEERAAREAEEAEAEQKRRQERLEEAIGRAAIPLRFQGCRFDGYRADTPEQQKVLRRCREYAQDFDRHRRTGESLVLIGRRGTGKTHLAAAILQDLLPEHVGLYTTAQDMIAMIRATWGGTGSTDAVMKVLCNVPLLVIDEIGVQSGSESEQALLFQVLDHRYRERRPVVLVGNMQVGEMERYLGERVLDRLREIASVQACEWGSYRREAREQQG